MLRCRRSQTPYLPTPFIWTLFVCLFGLGEREKLWKRGITKPWEVREMGWVAVSEEAERVLYLKIAVRLEFKQCCLQAEEIRWEARWSHGRGLACAGAPFFSSLVYESAPLRESMLKYVSWFSSKSSVCSTNLSVHDAKHPDENLAIPVSLQGPRAERMKEIFWDLYLGIFFFNSQTLVNWVQTAGEPVLACAPFMREHHPIL